MRKSNNLKASLNKVPPVDYVLFKYEMNHVAVAHWIWRAGNSPCTQYLNAETAIEVGIKLPAPVAKLAKNMFAY